jgi:putative transposase
MTRKTRLAPEEYYHVYNRGVDKRVIFQDDTDHRYFLTLLYLANTKKPFATGHLSEEYQQHEFFSIDRGETLVDIGAYCLMPNHFHILLKEKEEGGTSLFMQKLGTAYTMYFNRKHERTGALFQGTFKARHVDNDRYLKYLYAYIHLNPIKMVDKGWKAKKIINKSYAKGHLATYEFSSYPEYIGVRRPENNILSSEKFPKYFRYATDFKSMITEWVAFNEV